ncbi:ATP-binding protein [Streptomyces sp. NPDC085479]|uniref:ATP-binding protein n=1 Tax=Streptomyces sp. NPDC085479 TaxID=3365726 RepID=UPI0037CE37F8
MTGDDLTAAGLDHLQRVGFVPPPPGTASSLTQASATLRTMVRVTGIGRLNKGGSGAAGTAEQEGAAAEFGGPTGPSAAAGGRSPLAKDLLVSLYNYMVPLAFLVSAEPGRAAIRIGTWLPAESTSQSSDQNGRLLTTSLNTLYPSVDLVDESPGPSIDVWPPRGWQRGGLVMGIPTPKPPDPTDGAAQLDRLLRALHQFDWAALVLAQPVGEGLVRDLKLRLINDMRIAQTASTLGGVPSPLTQHYLELMARQLKAFTDAQGAGAWRTAVYLLGDDASYPQLASLWRGVYSGASSLPEAVRVWDRDDVPGLASAWAMCDPEPDTSAPGSYRQPFQHQTLLTSTQLAAYVHLPNLETDGFSIRTAPAFDVVPADVTQERSITLGQIMQRGRRTGATYAVTPKSLTRHTFVAGVTGSGKTNTLIHLLTEIDRRSIPFLVIEPSKTEYRAMSGHPALAGRLRVFTPGKETVAPLRLNPLEVPPHIGIGEHLDLLRAVFGASFAMWGPLPQVLERCLHEVYEDRGWDLRTSTNRRLEPQSAAGLSWRAFPTLTDLGQKVRDVVPRLGYEPRTQDDIQAALLTRLDSMRSGGKGATLDTPLSVPDRELFDAPAVIELEGMGDDDDKAFLIGLLLIRLAEHRRAGGPSDDLAHLLVIEEAHRLISNVTRGGSEYVANPRGQAVETFTNLLSEIRAYGQGVVIADQVPVRLAPDVVKNTNLKIAHRVVAADDRAVLGGSMSMSDAQERYVSTLGIGRAAVFSDGDDAPLLVAVPRAEYGGRSPQDADVAQAMRRWRSDLRIEGLYQARPYCTETCADAPWACALARTLLEDGYVRQTVARLALSTAEHTTALDRLWPEIVAVLRARRTSPVPERPLLTAFAGHAADWYAERRGTQAGWSYQATDALASALRAALISKAQGGREDTDHEVRGRFQAQMRELHRRDVDPYPDCDRVCDHAPLCLYRSAAGDLVASRRHHARWQRAEDTDARTDGGRLRRETWNTARGAAYELFEQPHPGIPEPERTGVAAAADRVALCFAQQMLATDDRKVPGTARWIADRLLAEADSATAGNGAKNTPTGGEPS